MKRIMKFTFLCLMQISIQTTLFSCGSNHLKTCKVSMLHMHPLYQQRERNITTICDYAEQAFNNGANIVVAPEMATDFYYVTEDDVRGYAGIKNVEVELSKIANVAKTYGGYICMGYPEIAEDGTLYNSAVLFNDKGKVVLHERKRCLSSWNSIGDLPYLVYNTEYGKLGIVICADSYVDTHAKALKKLGVDMILSPVTWYPTEGHGDDDSTNAWKARAKENKIWYVTCNRWGFEEHDGKFEDMNRAKSCVVSPEGEIVYCYQAEDKQYDNILYYTINR